MVIGLARMTIVFLVIALALNVEATSGLRKPTEDLHLMVSTWKGYYLPAVKWVEPRAEVFSLKDDTKSLKLVLRMDQGSAGSSPYPFATVS